MEARTVVFLESPSHKFKFSHGGRHCSEMLWPEDPKETEALMLPQVAFRLSPVGGAAWNRGAHGPCSSRATQDWTVGAWQPLPCSLGTALCSAPLPTSRTDAGNDYTDKSSEQGLRLRN